VAGDGLPKFHLSLNRSDAPDEPPEPFGLLDLTLETKRDLAALLDELRAVAPGASLQPVQMDQTHLGLAWETVSNAADLAPTLIAGWQNSGQTRLIERLELIAALAIAGQLEADTSPLILRGAASILGVSPRLDTNVSPNSSLVTTIATELDGAPFTRDQLAFTLSGLGVIEAANANSELDVDRTVPLAEAMADRIIHHWCDVVGRRPSNLPLYDFKEEREPADWNLAQPFVVARWIMLDQSTAHPLVDHIRDFGTDRVISRRVFPKFPKGRHQITAHANLPLNAPSVHMLNVSIMAPANPPERPSAAHGSGQIDPATGVVTTDLTLALGEPLSYTAECFAVIGEGADIRQVLGPPIVSDRQILTLTAQDFGMQVVHHHVDLALLEMADITLTQTYQLNGVQVATDFVLEGAELIAVLPSGSDGGTLRLTAREKGGAGEIILPEFPLTRLDITLALFDTFGRQEVAIHMVPPPFGVVGIDVLAGLTGDENMQTFAFTQERSQRSFVYSAQSLFAPGFRWRFTGDQDWQIHSDPKQTLQVAPPT